MTQGVAKKSSYASRKKRQRTADILAFAAIIILAACAMLPLWWIFRSSLMTDADIFKNPPPFFPIEWLWSNYAETLESFKFWTYLKNTMTIIVPSVTFGTLTAISCAYAFARLRFRGKRFFFTLSVGSMLLPSMVTLIPLYIAWVQGLDLGGTYWPLILPYLCGGGAFNIFLIRQFIRTVPRELDEAAKIDGAGPFRVLTNIIVPAIKPAIIVVALLLFITLWNDLLQQTVYIGGRPEMTTIAIGLTLFVGSYGNDWAYMMAATCMSFGPGVIFYLIGQRHFVEGIVLTGMKN